jgi:hypothetical protein
VELRILTLRRVLVVARDRRFELRRLQVARHVRHTLPGVHDLLSAHLGSAEAGIVGDQVDDAFGLLEVEDGRSRVIRVLGDEATAVLVDEDALQEALGRVEG